MKKRLLKRPFLKGIYFKLNQGKRKNIFYILQYLLCRSGTLKKGELKDVELMYNPSNIDENDLPFKSKKGKKVNGEKHQLRVVL